MTSLRTESFVPLTNAPAGRGGKELSVTVIREGEQVRPFKSLEPLAAAPVSSPKPHPEKVCEPKVILHRDGDRITGLRIQCSCGQVMDLACVYDAATKA